MSDIDELSDDMLKVLDRARKLMELASNNPNPEEAASAMAKAQSYLTQYNLDASLIEKAKGKADGKREQKEVDGGFYLYERTLYEAVAKLNFCVYYTEEYYGIRTKTIVRRGRTYAKGDQVLKKRHRVIGRIVNTMATKFMCETIYASIERLIREKLTIRDGAGERIDYGQLYSNWGISFREGAVQTMCEKIEEQRISDEKARKRKAAENLRKAKAAGGASSLSTALTLSDYAEAEDVANYDYEHGAGAWAEKLEQDRRNAEYWKARRAKEAKMAKENPEEYAELVKQRRKDSRGSWGRQTRERNVDSSAYYAGREAGNAISLNRQTSGGAPVKTARLEHKS